MSPASNLWQCGGTPIGSFVEGGVNHGLGLEERIAELSAKNCSTYNTILAAYFQIDPDLRQAFFKGSAVLVYRSDKPQLWMVQCTLFPKPKPPTES